MAKSFHERAAKVSRGRALVWLGSVVFTVGCSSQPSDGKNKTQGPASESGCTKAPACGTCVLCFETCVCETGDFTKCKDLCPADPGSGAGGAGAVGSAAGGAGAFSGGPGGGVSSSGGFTSAGASGASGSSGTGPFSGGSSSLGGAGTGAGGDVSAGGSTGGGGIGGSPGTGCGQTLPPVTDYGANGPYPTTTVNNTGPDGMYTVIRPTTLGANGFKHPPATWGNGITTNPTYYPGLLSGIASHGFVIVASNSTSVTAQLMTDGLDWLVKQNDAAGDYQGKLDPKCLITIGYSLGGGAAVTAGAHADVVATVSMHGVTGNSAALHAPLLLFTSTMDTFVTASGFVTPTYNASTVQTFYATLTGAGDAGHLTPIGNAGPERAPMIAWLRLWAYGDQAGRQYFDGADCTLCKDPWGSPQKKNWH